MKTIFVMVKCERGQAYTVECRSGRYRVTGQST
jgi:hypothetical protein